MRRIIMAAVAVAALTVPAVSMANAGSSSGINTGGVGTSQGNVKNMTTQYKATYVDPVMGAVSCVGVHKQGVNTGAVNGSDSWTCTSTTGSPLLGGYAPDSTNQVGWNSDYWPLTSHGQVATTTATFTMSADGMSETGTALYN
jgi:hypothetical protein